MFLKFPSLDEKLEKKDRRWQLWVNVYHHILTNFSILFYFLLVHNDIKSGNTASDVTLKKIQISAEEKLEKNTKNGVAVYYSLGR